MSKTRRKPAGPSGVRTTVYIQKEVKKRMKDFEKEEFVSWSEVATNAFGRYIEFRRREKANGEI